MIETLSAEDAMVMAALHAGSFAAPWPAEDFAALMRSPGAAAWAIGAPLPAGFLLTRRADDEAEILTLAVAPDRRRQGLARSLLDHAVTVLAAGGVARVFLEVAADNAAAIALYTAAGFAPCGRRAGYYTAGGRKAAPVDAVVMMRRIGTGT